MVLIPMPRVRSARPALLGENNGCKGKYNDIAGLGYFQHLPYKIPVLVFISCQINPTQTS